MKDTEQKMNLTYCTLTGVDNHACEYGKERIGSLSAKFPFVEWGFLYSPTRQGYPGRYPSLKLIVETLKQLHSSINVSLHLCGDGVSNLLNGFHTELALLDLVANRGGRVQLNFNHSKKPVDIEALITLINTFPNTTFITQANGANSGVREQIAPYCGANYAVLFDSSGGRGNEAESWPDAFSSTPCGYAGGLGPDNIAEQLEKIALASNGRPVWIDMESKIRSSHIDMVDHFEIDRLDLDKCESVLKSVNHYKLLGKALWDSTLENTRNQGMLAGRGSMQRSLI